MWLIRRPMRNIQDVAKDIGLGPDDLITHGPHIAKIAQPTVRRLADAPKGKLVLVSAINPTKAGEGKTTMSIALGQGLQRRGRRVVLALREPSLGPVFGAKGGGTGGGRCKLEPSARINLHFTGDLHAVTAAHNLLAAMLDNAIHFRAALDLEHRQVLWRRVLDVNDRVLRDIVVGLGGRSDGVPREDGFDITAASEVMAILCLARDIPDLKARLGRILVGFDRKGAPVTAGDVGANGAMAALLADAVLPNLVQTTEGVPAIVHGGPFGNIAHGCNSIIGTRTALSLGDYTVTEAGFGFDLGAEKFFDIKCRTAGLWPSAVVLVASVRALRSHGGGDSDRASLEAGLSHLEHHVANVRAFGFDPVIAVNTFSGDSDEDLGIVERACAGWKLGYARCTGFADGGAGAERLADVVVEAAARPAPSPRFLYKLEDSFETKITNIARTIYGASDVEFSRLARSGIERANRLGFANLPVCIAKTHLSLSDDPAAVGKPEGFTLNVRAVRVSAGAGYVLALCGDIVTMPGLPAQPQALKISLSDDGEILGVT
jgi:formate--tetrahydrofolate ligase